MAADERRQTLRRRAAELDRRLEELKSRFPAHSIPPAMLAELDELDLQLAETLAELERARA